MTPDPVAARPAIGTGGGPDMHTVLIVGSGAREHALGWACARDGARVVSMPGNPGLAAIGDCRTGAPTDADRVSEVAGDVGADMVLIGPEAPLAAGVADRVRADGFAVFGPSRAAARMESSKRFAREFMVRHGIPGARFASFDALGPALAHLDEVGLPCVIKADGLAAGKGVVVCHDRRTAETALTSMLDGGVFGDAGRRVLIEECLVGEEVSVFGITDGHRIVSWTPSQDHKPVFDGDRGPNTGGMGAYAPWHRTDATFESEVRRRILEPTIAGMAAEGFPMQGCLYAGLMVTDDGPRVVEFNCRFGDPETEVVLPLHADGALGLLMSAARGELDPTARVARDGAAVSVVLASGGYPGSYETGVPISGHEAVAADDVLVFHAGTARGSDGVLSTAGGRVLAVTALGPTIEAARDRAYDAADRIAFAGKHARRDIAAKALEAV